MAISGTCAKIIDSNGALIFFLDFEISIFLIYKIFLHTAWSLQIQQKTTILQFDCR